jgi:RNA polymerase sigma factor (sigma-70 family)
VARGCDSFQESVSHSMKPRVFARHSDLQLLDLAVERQASEEGRQAAAELLKRYREPVYRWCRTRVRDPELALDLSQDVLLSAYRNLHTFGGRAQFSTWVFAIARNRCLNALRRPSLFADEDDEGLDHLPDPRVGQDEALEQREEEERVLDLIVEHLPPLDQQVLWLRCFEKMPVDAITRLLAITEASGARGILQRARRRLRAAMARRENVAGRGTDD